MVAVPEKLGSGVKTTVPFGLEVHTPALAGLALAWLRLVKDIADPCGS